MKPQRQEKRLMGDDPLAADAILERFYKPDYQPDFKPDYQPDFKPDYQPDFKPAVAPVNDAPLRVESLKKEKPTHYKVVCISLYNEDIEHLESMVAELKRRGHTKANKSQLIRAALAQVDLAKIPKGF
jgi:hypothetical protein